MKMMQLLQRNMKKGVRSSGAVVLVGLALAAVSGRAAELVTPYAATAQSYYSGDDRAPVHAIDGSGMTPSAPVTILSTAGTATKSAMWLSNGTKATWITFDPGAVRTITGFHPACMSAIRCWPPGAPMPPPAPPGVRWWKT